MWLRFLNASWPGEFTLTADLVLGCWEESSRWWEETLWDMGSESRKHIEPYNSPPPLTLNI